MARHRSDGLQTRGKLLSAAGAVFAEKGFRDATTAEICRKAGANIAAVNYHFRSKEQLYVEAWRYAFERSVEAYPPDGGVPAAAPAEDRLRGRIRALVGRMMDPGSLDFDIAHKEMANPTGLLGEVMHRAIEPMRRGFMDLVRELLGGRAASRQVQLCAMSIHAQCSMPLLCERRRKMLEGRGAPPGPPRLNVAAGELSEHIFHFSLAGLRVVKSPRGRRTRAGVAARVKR